MIVTLSPITPVGLVPGSIDWTQVSGGRTDACEVKVANYSNNGLKIVIAGNQHWLEPWMANKFPAQCANFLQYQQITVSSVAGLPAGATPSILVTVSFGEELPGIYPVPLYGTLPLDTLGGDIAPIGPRTPGAGATGLAADAGHHHPLQFDVMFYGAIGDGVTDDTAAFQAAFDAAKNALQPGGEVWVPTPRSFYKIAGNLLLNTLAYSSITIRGASNPRFSSAPLLLFTGSGVGLTIKGTDDTGLATSIRGVKLENLKLDATGSAGITDVVYLKSFQDVKFVEVWFRGGSNSGIKIARVGPGYTATDVKFTDCYWSGNGNYDVHCDDSGTNTQINGLHMYQGELASAAAIASIRLYATDFGFYGTEFYSSATLVEVLGCLGGGFWGCHFEAPTTRCVLVDVDASASPRDPVGITIASCRFFPGASNPRNAIHVNDANASGIHIGPNSFENFSGMLASDALISCVAGTAGIIAYGNIAFGLGAGSLYGTGTGIGGITAATLPSGNLPFGSIMQLLAQWVTDVATLANHWVLRQGGVTKWIVYLVGSELRFNDGATDRLRLIAGGEVVPVGGVGLDNVDHAHSLPLSGNAIVNVLGLDAGGAFTAQSLGGTVLGAGLVGGNTHTSNNESQKHSHQG